MNKAKLKKGILIGCMVSAALLLGFLGSYAYFISTGNNNQNQSTNVQTGNMALTFSDGNNGINEALNFGESITKTFTIENTGSLEAKAKINWLNLTNTYLKESLTYTLFYSESEDGEYTEIVTNKNVPRSDAAITKTLANNLTIPAGIKYYYKLEITLNYLEDIDQTPDLKAILSTEFILEEGIEESLETLRNLGLKIKNGSPTFAESATTDETADGLYAMKDDYGTSYYFRGASENNYVKFGGFYWRIIRINGDGSLRMIYDGTNAHANGENSADRLALQGVAWNPQNNDPKYVGYMYGGAAGSASTSKEQAQTNEVNTNIKTQLENWYKINIRDKGLDEYVSDSIYCNDRSTPGSQATGLYNDTGLGYGINTTAYGATARSNVWNTDVSKVQPTFVCPQKNDAFTKEDVEKGNGALGEKVGLITVDEVVAAGGKHNITNLDYYLGKGFWYWLLSPHSMSISSDVLARICIINNIGQFTETYVRGYGGVAPVISLTSEYVSTMTGDGTMSNPYVA